MVTSPFTGTMPSQTGVIWTDAEIRDRARKEYEAKLAKQQAAWERKKTAIEDQRTGAAQDLVDYISGMGGLTWDGVDQFAYGSTFQPDQIKGMEDWIKERYPEAGADLAQFYAIPEGAEFRDGGTLYGSIEGGENWIPSLEEATAILDAWAANPRLDLQPMTGAPQTPQEMVRQALGEDLPDQFVNYLASQTQFADNTDGGRFPFIVPMADYVLGGSFIRNDYPDVMFDPITDPVLGGRATWRNPANEALSGLMMGATGADGLAGSAAAPLRDWQNRFNVDMNAAAPQSQWPQIARQLRQDSRARQESAELQNDAYQRFTLGNNYWGGVINDNYALPFDGRLEGYDPNNPLAYFGWDGSRFGQSAGRQPDSHSTSAGGWGMGDVAGGRFGQPPAPGARSQTPWGSSGWGGPWGGGV